MSLLAVYGTLRRNHSRNNALIGCEFVGEVLTEEPFKMYDLGQFPAIIRGGDSPIVVDLYKVDQQTVSLCDAIEGHPIFYRRETTTIDNKPVEIYVIQQDVSPYPQILSGDWNER